MMAVARRKYPIGIQTFQKLREEGYVYVDKTEYVYNLTHGSSSYIFLSRPRRFGKSLLTSTLASYFEAKMELFEGLAIEKLEKDWTAHPVLHFDMSTAKHCDKEDLLSELNLKLKAYEKTYGHDDDAVNPNQRLQGLIERAYKQTGQKVVVLIDEYDAPLLDVMHEDTQLPVLRQVMRNFYSPLKACDPYLRFVFITGITKFSQLSIFSELNNINNISMDPEYAGICGITKEELLAQFADGIEDIAKAEEMTTEDALVALTSMYDGYHFSWPSPDVFNPFSLLNAFAKKRLNAYWFGSGTPTYLIEMMKKFNFQPANLTKTEAMVQDFDAPTQTMTTIVPLLYQSGYFTIKAYNRTFRSYTLDVPNNEVRLGLMGSLIPYYISPDTLTTNNTVVAVAKCLYKDDMDGALSVLQCFLSTIPQCSNTDYEGHWQQVLYIIFSLLGNYCDVEVHTATGRVDLVMATKTRLYLIETKLNQSAEAAMNQINLKEYDKRFALYTLPVIKVGINFDSDKRTLADWKIES